MKTIKQYKSELGKYLSTTPYIRVIRMAKTPDYEDFRKSSLRVLVAIILVGFVGFIIFELMSLLPM